MKIKPIRTFDNHSLAPQSQMSSSNETFLAIDLFKNDKFISHFNELNQTLGGALSLLEPAVTRIEGRDKEVAELEDVLRQKDMPVAILLGQAGVGKTETVKEFVRQINTRQSSHDDIAYFLVSLRLGMLGSIGYDNMKSALAGLLHNLKNLEEQAKKVTNHHNLRLVLFIDEVHLIITIFGRGTKIGGDLMKDVLTKPPVPVIAATTRREFDTAIATDRPFAERFNQIEMEELPKHIVKQILTNWWNKHMPNEPVPSNEVLDRVLQANEMYRAEEAEPRKSLKIMDAFYSYVSRTGQPITKDVVDEIFKNRFSINLELHVDVHKVNHAIAKRIKGQTFAVAAMKKFVNSMSFRLDPNTNKPLGTALFTGPTGVGKTEMVKALSEAIYPGRNVLFNINMPDYSSDRSSEAFRKRLGERIRHNPDSIVLLDEIEKAHPTIYDDLLVILDEGLVSFTVTNVEGVQEVNTVSMKNSIVIATSNAGHEIFANNAKYSQQLATKNTEYSQAVAESELRSLSIDLRHHFIEAVGWRPEFLGRFNRIVPFAALDEETLLRIAEAKLQAMIEKFKIRGYDIILSQPRQWDPSRYNYITTDVALYITFVRAKADDPNSGGARNIAREIDSEIYDALVEAIVSNPNKRRFNVTIDKKSKIYNPGADATEGGVIVNAI